MRSSYTAAAIGVRNGSEVCGMGRPMPAEVARGGGDLMEVRGAWREANLDGSSGDWRAEQAQVQYGHELFSVDVFLSVSLDDGDLMLISGKVGGGGRCHPDGFSLHLLPTRQAPVFDLTSSHPPRYRSADHV